MGDKTTRLREAVPADVDAVTDVLIASMPADRDWWDYRFPHRARYPDDHRRFLRRLVQAWLSTDYEDWVVVVAEVCDDDDETRTGGTYRVAAYSAWDVSYQNYRKFGKGYQPRDLANALVPLPHHHRRDADPLRIEAYAGAAREGHDRFLDPRYGTEQIHLQALETHPSAARRGLARALCRWGMDQAARDGVVATLQAAPLARAVYPRFGFVELGEVKAQVAGEEACTFLCPMVWEPGKGA